MTTQSSHQSILGSSLLVAGTAIGAGMLALPITLGIAGFWPSIALLLIGFVFMLCNLFATLEAHLYSSTEHTHIITMCKERLGFWGESMAWIMFLFLMYAAASAYIVGGGAFVTHFIRTYTHLCFPHCGVWLFVGVTATVVFLGTRYVDYFNRFMLLGLSSSYIWLIMFGFHKIHFSSLSLPGHPAYLYAAVPVVCLAFTSHIILPSLRSYFKDNIPQLKKALLYGSMLPLLFYGIWQIFMIGILPHSGSYSLEVIAHRAHPIGAIVDVLQEHLGLSGVGLAVDYFSFFAIITSFLGVILSLLDFLADGLRMDAKLKQQRLILLALTLCPPILFAFFCEKGFVLALSYAGVSVAVLYGILPAWILWKARYIEQLPAPAFRLRGGRPMLLILLTGSVFVIILQCASALGQLPSV